MDADSNPTRLSDINIHVHGFTANDVIEGRLARKEAIRAGAIRMNPFCLASESLDALAAQYGIDSTYAEGLDDEDLAQSPF